MAKIDNILIDCTYIGNNWLSSNSLVIYAVRLIKGFLTYTSNNVFVLVFSDNEAMISSLVDQKLEFIILDRKTQTVFWRPLCKLAGILPNKLRQEIVRRNISIVLHPFHYGVLFFFPHNIRHYGIVHDVFLYERKKENKSKIYYFIWHLYQKLILNKFTRLISISNKTHKELLSRARVDSAIVLNSVTFDMTIDEEPIKRIRGMRYILNINRFQHHKNTKILILAFNILKNDIPHILYLKGDKEYEENRNELENLVKELGIKDRVFFDLDNRTIGELHYLYSHADLFVSPSLKEGFGYTPIEAALFKTPLLVSNIEVFKEVMCEKIPTFDPHSPEDLAKHMLKILNNPPSEQELSSLSEFYRNKYSLENQIHNLSIIMNCVE